MITSFRNHPIRWALGASAVVAALAWVAIGVFGVHTLFIDDVVSEAAPVFDAPATAAPSESTATPDPTATPTDPDATATPATPAAPGADDAAAAAAEPATQTAPVIETTHAGSFVDGAHPTTGSATVLGNGTTQRFLRFEEFATDNGPDLNVYLRDPDSGEYVDLGDLSGNIGDQNYELPADLDLDRFTEVDIWCVRFGVSFGTAQLASV